MNKYRHWLQIRRRWLLAAFVFVALGYISNCFTLGACFDFPVKHYPLDAVNLQCNRLQEGQRIRFVVPWIATLTVTYSIEDYPPRRKFIVDGNWRFLCLFGVTIPLKWARVIDPTWDEWQAIPPSGP